MALLSSTVQITLLSVTNVSRHYHNNVSLLARNHLLNIVGIVPKIRRTVALLVTLVILLLEYILEIVPEGKKFAYIYNAKTTFRFRKKTKMKNSDEVQKVTSIVGEAMDFVSHLLKEKLTDQFKFHDYTHTAEVAGLCEKMGEYYHLSDADLENLLLAAWFHDTGFIRCYSGHEGESARIAGDFLISKGFDNQRVKSIQDLILSTKAEIKPVSLHEQILHDADIQHIGKKSFFDKGKLLRKEWELILHNTYGDDEWEWAQHKFLTFNEFATKYAREKFGSRLKKNIDKQKTLLNKVTSKKEKGFDTEKTGRGTETMYRVSYRNHINLSDIADKKANMMMSINTLILSAIIAIAGSGFAMVGGQEVEYYRFGIPMAILLLTSLGSVIFAILSAKPNVTHNLASDIDLKDRKSSILYFGNFTQMPLEDYLTDMETLRGDNKLLYENMSMDIYYLGQVLKKKFRLLQFSYSVFMAGLILAVVSLIFILIYSKYITKHPIF